jgi:hypothetical protein
VVKTAIGCNTPTNPKYHMDYTPPPLHVNGNVYHKDVEIPTVSINTHRKIQTKARNSTTTFDRWGHPRTSKR